MRFHILKIFISAVFLLIFSVNVSGEENYNGKMLKTGISLTEQIPSGFFGTWRVKSFLKQTNSPESFKKENIDIWNLSKSGDVINLSNPFTGASASVSVGYVEGTNIKFSRKGNYDGRILTDTVELKLSKDKFTGVNTLVLEVLSGNSVIKTSKAVYILEGEKIAGGSE